MAEKNPPGDASAFGELYGRQFPEVYRFVYSRLRDKQAADEVTSRVFGRALASIGHRRDVGKPVAVWLYQLAAAEVARRGDEAG